jgi:hypothetical protein
LPGWPFGLIPTAFGPLTSTGSSAGDMAIVVIPAKTKPGYAYKVTAPHHTGPLGLTCWFQVCTLKPTALRIVKGRAVRLKGVVPISGHEGSTAGRATTVTMFARTRSAGQPSKWNPTSQGWRKVATAKTNRLGAYATKALRPGRTTWYVAQYPGDSRHFRAYTSVVKVRVR